MKKLVVVLSVVGMALSVAMPWYLVGSTSKALGITLLLLGTITVIVQVINGLKNNEELSNV